MKTIFRLILTAGLLSLASCMEKSTDCSCVNKETGEETYVPDSEDDCEDLSTPVMECADE